jgi:hypothetical protein
MLWLRSPRLRPTRRSVGMARRSARCRAEPPDDANGRPGENDDGVVNGVQGCVYLRDPCAEVVASGVGEYLDGPGEGLRFSIVVASSPDRKRG